MQTNLLDEFLLSGREAVAEPALRSRRGKPAHIAKFYRLIASGSIAEDGSRVLLESVKLPTGIFTSREAIRRFIERLNHVGRAGQPESAHLEDVGPTAVERKLDALGLS